MATLAALNSVWSKDPGTTAKNTPYPLVAHLLDTYMTSNAVWDTWLSPRLRKLFTDALTKNIGTQTDREKKAKQLIGLAAALHDVGKANPLFQLQEELTYEPAWRKELLNTFKSHGLNAISPLAVPVLQNNLTEPTRRHEHIGFLALNAGEPVDKTSKTLLRHRWLQTVVAGHHGRWQVPTKLTKFYGPALVSGTWGDLQKTVIGIVEEAVGISLEDIPILDVKRAPTIIMLATGMVILADWLASSDIPVDTGKALIAGGGNPNDAQSWIEEREASLFDFVTGSIGSYVAPDDPIETVLGTKNPYPLQADAIKHGNNMGLWIVAYPTGEGKTQAALLRHMARTDEGFLFGLPTRATTNAMKGRLDEIFTGTGNRVILSHQFAIAHQAEASDGCLLSSWYGTDWFTSGLTKLMAPVSTSTVDQILMGALRQRYIALRLLALANHHVVLDEVHTYDQYQATLLSELLAWWGATGTRVTLLSATLPSWQQKQFENAYLSGVTGVSQDKRSTKAPTYPSHRFVETLKQSVVRSPRLASVISPIIPQVFVTTDKVKAHIEWATNTHQTSPNCHIAVILNTIDSCIEVARQVKIALPQTEVICLHSRMTLEHREGIESYLATRLGQEAERGSSVIVIATSVIEASLDLDFDFMSTDIAPASSIIQRAGRLWRFHDDERRVERFGTIPSARQLHIVIQSAQGEEISYGNALPFPRKELERVRQELASRQQIRVPEDVQSFVDHCAFDITDYKEMSKTQLTTDQKEIQRITRMYDAGEESKAKLMKITADAASKYQDLADISERNDKEELMRTRYIDLPGRTFLLIDTKSSGVQHALQSSLKSLKYAYTDPPVVKALEFTIPASGKTEAEMRSLHEQTISRAGMDEWKPRVKMLSTFLPVAFDLLEKSDMLEYDNYTGLTKK